MPDSKKQSLEEDALAKEIGSRIAAARNGLGWSQHALHTRTKLADAEGKGISRAVLSLYETGTNKPGSRELRLLCEALKVTPNWVLYGTETPASTIQPSLEFMRGNDLKLSVRLAFAMLAVDPKVREALAVIIFSSLEKQLSDIQLSSLMTMAGMVSDKLLEDVIDQVGEGAKELPIRELIDRFIREAGEAFYTNYGNLRPAIPEELMDDFDPNTPPPPRKSQQ